MINMFISGFCFALAITALLDNEYTLSLCALIVAIINLRLTL